MSHEEGFDRIDANIEARYPAFNKAILDFGKLATHLTNDQSMNN
jgi:hypothetical protein